MCDEYDKALDQAAEEYKEVYTKKLKFVKNSATRGELTKAVSMRARDIFRENDGVQRSPIHIPR